MAYNLPTVTNNNISFGPGVVRWGGVGSTPTGQVGAISEDGVTLELTNEKKYITQGNPKLNQLVFSQTQGASISFTSIEWELEDSIRRGMGTGFSATTINSGWGTAGSRWGFGGDPTPLEVAIRVDHKMGISGHTIILCMWRACSDAGFTIPLGQDEHQFEYKFSALSTSTDWAGDSLDTNNENLFRIVRVTA